MSPTVALLAEGVVTAVGVEPPGRVSACATREVAGCVRDGDDPVCEGGCRNPGDHEDAAYHHDARRGG